MEVAVILTAILIWISASKQTRIHAYNELGIIALVVLSGFPTVHCRSNENEPVQLAHIHAGNEFIKLLKM